MHCFRKWTSAASLLAIACFGGTSALGAVTIYGGAPFNGGAAGSGGISGQSIQLSPGVSVIAGGTALARGTAYYYAGPTAAPAPDGTASFVYTPTTTTTLGSLGTQSDGNPNSAYAYALNRTGQVAGYTADQSFSVITAVLWNAGGTPQALQPLSTNSTGGSTSFAYALNDANIAAGTSTQFSGSTNLGNRPVFWAAGSTTPTPLGIYPTGRYSGIGNSNVGSVQYINTSGVMVGYDEMFASSGGAGTGSDLGPRATLWVAGGGAAVELPHFSSTGTGGTVGSFARVINDAGTVGGYVTNYATAGVPTGQIPVRWIPSGSTYTLQPLDTVGTSTTGSSGGTVTALNAAGDAIGSANNYTNAGVLVGQLPELWKAGGTAVTPLAILGTNPSNGTSLGSALGINDARFSVGSVSDFSNGGDAFGTSGGTSVATLWAGDGSVIDLNTLIPTVTAASASPGWVLLTQADGITNDGWISGIGTYNPGGGLPNYTRAFLIQETALELLGDANGDGKVDLSDLNIVLSNLGTTTSLRSMGNFDGAATIDLTDLNDVLNNLGTGANKNVAVLSARVPEPVSIAILAAMLPILVLRRQARAHEGLLVGK